MLESLFFSKKSLVIRGSLYDLSVPQVMGILNVTPDSFYDGGRLRNDKAVCSAAEAHLGAGAVWLDLGGQSTRPGAALISEKEEWKRIQGALRALKRAFPSALISVDTFYTEVAKAALGEGADLINDVSGGGKEANSQTPEESPMFQLVAQYKTPYVLMHSRGYLQPSHQNTQYENLIEDMWRYFKHRIEGLLRLRHADFFLDCGFGFAKTPAQNFFILQHLSMFKRLGYPLMVGLSRKSMIYKTLSSTPHEALHGTTALHMVALQQGAKLLRTHDVGPAMNCIKLFEQLRKTSQPTTIQAPK